jgi:hypothetical protein
MEVHEGQARSIGVDRGDASHGHRDCRAIFGAEGRGVDSGDAPTRPSITRSRPTVDSGDARSRQPRLFSTVRLWTLTTPPSWTLATRLVVIPWTLVTHTNRKESIIPANSLRRQSPH